MLKKQVHIFSAWRIFQNDMCDLLSVSIQRFPNGNFFSVVYYLFILVIHTIQVYVHICDKISSLMVIVLKIVQEVWPSPSCIDFIIRDFSKLPATQSRQIWQLFLSV